MSDVFTPRLGGTLSADIAVPEHERELRFYSRVLSTGKNPLWREDLMNNLGMPIIGLGARIPEYAHLPLQWMPHIQVADVADSAKRALDLGGSELMRSEDNAWAVLLDPNGAAFGIIPLVSAEEITPAEAAAAPAGCIPGLDLTVSDAPAARDFYSQVVGWSAQDMEQGDAARGDTDFSMRCADGSPAAGIRHARGVNLGLPPVWLIHLPVGDLAESLRRVGEEGGKVIQATRGGAGSDACAVIQDPVGAVVTLVPG